MVANVTVATTDKWRDKSTGESRTATEWHRVSYRMAAWPVLAVPA